MSTNADLLARRTAAVARGVGHTTPISAARALNAEVWDVEGKRYVDFAGGIAVLNTGHCHPKVIAAVKAQMEHFTHTCFQVLMYEPYIALAERLNAIAPIDGPAKSLFFTTGAEATENAVKIARIVTGRPGIIAFTGAFHGRTNLAVTLTGKVQPYKKGLPATLPDIFHVPFPVAQLGVSIEETLRHLDFIFKADVAPENVAAIIIEPVQGEGGFHMAPPTLMRALRRICDQHGILLIADEVQTGFGRTGKMFAMEHYDVHPDLICVAKSLAGGFPLSGVIGKADVIDGVDPGGLGGTYAGNPLACAAALAVLDVFAEEKLVERANIIGDMLVNRIKGWETRNDLVPISAVRGPGAMIAFDIVRDRGTFEPDADATRRVVQRAWENGLVLLSCGTAFNTIRILVPLTAGDDVLHEGMDILETALAAD